MLIKLLTVVFGHGLDLEQLSADTVTTTAYTTATANAAATPTANAATTLNANAAAATTYLFKLHTHTDLNIIIKEP